MSKAALRWFFVLGWFLAFSGLGGIPYEHPPAGRSHLPSLQTEVLNPQIELVIDISGSMGTIVLPDDLPADLAELRDRIQAIENSPEYKRLTEHMAEIEKDPQVAAARGQYEQANLAVEDWLNANGYGYSYEIRSTIQTQLKDAGCNESWAYSLVSADSLEDADKILNSACQSVGVTPQLRAAVQNALGFLSNSAYQDLKTSRDERYQAYQQAREALGYAEVSKQYSELLQNENYYQVQEDLDKRAKELGYPSRLDLAKQSALTMLDLSRLDALASGRQTRVGLVTFATQGANRQSLTEDYTQLEQQIDALQPLDATNMGAGLTLALDELRANLRSGQPAAIILLSDGQTNTGLTAEQIRQQIPPQANQLKTRVCSVGFGSQETDVDAELLRGLADDTQGEYVFARSGQELVSFFVACRQGLISENVRSFTSRVFKGQTAEAGTFEVLENTASLSLTLTYLVGDLDLEILDPTGRVLDQSSSEVSIKKDENVQLVLIENPAAGQWSARVRGNDTPESGSLFSVVVGTQEKPRPTITPLPSATPTPTPTPANTSTARLMLFSGLCCGVTLLLVLLAAAAVVLVAYLRRS
ncbi:MAG: vWA domain-containing protein [Chloroflexota bacterium]